MDEQREHPRKAATFLVALVALTGLLAGCTGPAPTDDDADDGTNETGDGTQDNGTDNETDDDSNASDDNETGGGSQWTFEERNGTAVGANVTVGNATLAREPLDVENGTLELRLQVEASGGELDVCVTAPSESNATNTTEPACSDEFQTLNGTAEWSVRDPAAGNWTVTLTPTSGSPPAVEYELLIGRRVPVETQMI
jgi:hypothetical protein